MGVLGTTFDTQKRFGPPKVPQEAPPGHHSLVGADLGVIFFEIFCGFGWVCFYTLSFVDLGVYFAWIRAVF